MGSNVAPPYANSYMALFEEEIVYPDPLFQAHCPFWKRYIDDVFCIWTESPILITSCKSPPGSSPPLDSPLLHSLPDCYLFSISLPLIP
ncbi:unnamed protein product [Ranitomeya imitator]|uniref:Uncharacterized protein n=1 Tax=Ranitomeya imitator TaxID=111125 RepID=A0ABN9MDY6_9NEOB|nr:unnamed protein product [Ranitomeya imitator]